MPLRILHLYAGNLHGGIERMLVTLARERGACAEMEPEFGLCFEGRLSGELRDAGVRVNQLGRVRFSRPWTLLAARRRLCELLRAQSFDAAITHSAWPHAVFAPAVRDCGLRLIHWVHDVPSGRRLIDRLARRTRPDLVLANSQFTAGHVGPMFAGVRCEVQYPLVSSLPATPGRATVRRRVRAEMRCPEDAVVIVCACRLERWKGHAILLDALAQLGGHEQPWQCWIAGGVQRPNERAYLDELEERARRLGLNGQVRFLGQRQDVAELLAAADVHCQPNTAPEPFGIAFVEAMCAGLPVVTSDLGGAREIVDAVAGTRVPAGDVPALAAALASQLAIGDGERARRSAAVAAGAARWTCADRWLASLHNLVQTTGAR